MEAVIAEHELFDSCRILFGAELQITRHFLEYLQHSGIKSAYRKKALETHPDVLADQGDVDQGADLFRMVHQAYANLTTYLHARDNGFRFPSPTRVQPAPGAVRRPPPASRPRPPQAGGARPGNSTRSDSAGTARPSAAAWKTGHTVAKRGIPRRKLLFGHYLYYAGLTNWQTIVKALVWQRTGRPRLGEIGRRFGWLSDQDILTILRQRSLSQPFGSSAVSLGFITDRQLRLMLFHQGKLQKKFGEYFVQHNHLTQAQLHDLSHQFFQHNAAFERPSFAYGGR